jgi:methylthioribulose-1-phosphate dehydratase
MKNYPDAAGVLVRRHGVYVWGQSPLRVLHALQFIMFAVGADWEKAKTQTEVRLIPLSYYGHLSSPLSIQCLDYLFEISVKMKLAGLPTLLV